MPNGITIGPTGSSSLPSGDMNTGSGNDTITGIGTGMADSHGISNDGGINTDSGKDTITGTSLNQ
jgi:hypothetical protein